MRIFTGILIILSLPAAPGVAAAPQYQTTAPVAYMVDMASGAVLVNKDPHRKIAPASMTKIMTAYVIFDLIESGKLKPDAVFTVRPDTWKVWNNKGSTMFLSAGERVRVTDLLQGMLTVSGNDAAVVLADGIAGSEAAFVARMNATAKKLGMHNSHFASANGWPDEGRTLTTAHDLALLGRRTIQDFPALYRLYFGRAGFRWNNITQPNRNPLLNKVVGVDGMKTGFNDDAGYCFTGTAERNGRRLMLVVAGFTSGSTRAAETRRMMQWGFDAWRARSLYKANQVVARLPVQLGSESRVAVVAPRNLALALPAQGAPRYKLSVQYEGPIKAPVRKGAEVAKLVARFDDGREQTMPLIAAQSVGRAGFFRRSWNGLKLLAGA